MRNASNINHRYDFDIVRKHLLFTRYIFCYQWRDLNLETSVYCDIMKGPTYSSSSEMSIDTSRCVPFLDSDSVRELWERSLDSPLGLSLATNKEMKGFSWMHLHFSSEYLWALISWPWWQVIAHREQRFIVSQVLQENLLVASMHLDSL